MLQILSIVLVDDGCGLSEAEARMEAMSGARGARSDKVVRS